LGASGGGGKRGKEGEKVLKPGKLGERQKTREVEKFHGPKKWGEGMWFIMEGGEKGKNGMENNNCVKGTRRPFEVPCPNV